MLSERPRGVVGVGASEWFVGYLDAIRQRRPSVGSPCREWSALPSSVGAKSLLSEHLVGA